jgi:hypothetical protein
MPQTINNERLGLSKWVNTSYHLRTEEIPIISYTFVVDFLPKIVADGEEELSDEEILNLPEKMGIFSFLSDSEEDIYTENDGTAL